MGSTRLPGKVLLPIIQDKCSLELILERISYSTHLDQIIVATTTSPDDVKIVQLSERLGIKCFRGSEEDVLDRIYQTVCEIPFTPDAIVRLTGDCPLHDPNVIDQVIVKFFSDEYDYVSNVHPPTFPDGLDVEIFTFDALEKSWREAKLRHEREHVTQYMCNHPEIFKVGNVMNSVDFSIYRWALDEKDDYLFVKKIYEYLYQANNILFTMDDILKFLDQHPEILEINRKIVRNEGLIKSIKGS